MGGGEGGGSRFFPLCLGKRVFQARKLERSTNPLIGPFASIFRHIFILFLERGTFWAYSGLCLSDLYSAVLCYLSSTLLKQGNHMCLIACRIFLILYHLIQMLLNLMSDGLLIASKFPTLSLKRNWKRYFVMPTGVQILFVFGAIRS